MLSLRKYFQRPKRVSKTKPALPPFNADEFLELAHRQHAKKTSWRENRRIRREIREYELAAVLWQDLQETYPHERFILRGYYHPLMKAAAIFLAVVLVVVGLYALSRYYSISVSVHVGKKQSYNNRFNNTQLTEVAKVIEYNYARKVVFDRREIATKLLNGNIDTTRRVEEFLEELRLNGVDNYIDDKGQIHIK